MKAVLQRVKRASLTIDEKQVSGIQHGLFVLLGIRKSDSDEDITWLGDKVINLRIFEDNKGKLNKSLLDVKGEILLVSQFTLFADCRKGRRPSFDNAMPSEQAREMFSKFSQYLKSQNVKVEQGIFKARMEIALTNYGPVTIILDSKDK